MSEINYAFFIHDLLGTSARDIITALIAIIIIELDLYKYQKKPKNQTVKLCKRKLYISER